jgi:pimeloyl-ACP methyl ester carboxylesterase
MENDLWTFETVVEGVQVKDTTLLFRKGAIPLISFFNEEAGEVQYTQKDDGHWSSPITIGQASKDGNTFPFVSDPNGELYAVFTNRAGGLSYAYTADGRWKIEPLSFDQGKGIYPSLAIDSQKNLSISYYDPERRALAYVSRRNEKWQQTIIDESGDVGKYSSVAVDPMGNIHISYYDTGNQSLKYAHGKIDEQGMYTWIIATVDDQGNVGTWNSLSLDQAANPYISYYDETDKIIKFAYPDPQSRGLNKKSISVFHRSGQTFITWLEKADSSSEVYRIYRSDQPINVDNISRAQFLAQVGENSARFWASYSVADNNWRPRLSDRIVLQDNTSALPKGIGVLVWTLGAEDFSGGSNGTGYYAVTIIDHGKEILSPGYSSAGIEEAIADPEPVEMSKSTDTRPGAGGHYFIQYMDLRRWNPTFHAPNSTNQYYGNDPEDPTLKNNLAYAYDYAIFEPTADLCGGTVPDPLPVMIFLHGARNNRYGLPDVYPYPYCAYGIYPIDQSETWYFGFARRHDYRVNTDVEADDIIENYTEQRILRMVYDLMRNPIGPSVDQQRIYLFGHSMGGTGALAFAERYPNVFAATYSGQPVTLFRATTGVKENWPGLTAMRWGSQEFNLPVAITAPNHWAEHLQQYNGVGVFDWENLSAAFDPKATPNRAADEMAPFGIDHGTIDDAVMFITQGQPLYPLLNGSARAWAGAISEKNHEWSNFGWPPANLAKVNGVPFYNLGVIRDETIPGLSYLSSNETGLPQGPTLYNQAVLWSASWNPWDGAPVDSPEDWQMSFCAAADGSQRCGSEQNLTVDITPRRLQQFIVKPGMEYRWVLFDLPGGQVVDQGVVTADLNGLITIKNVPITPEGIRLQITQR